MSPLAYLIQHKEGLTIVSAQRFENPEVELNKNLQPVHLNTNSISQLRNDESFWILQILGALIVFTLIVTQYYFEYARVSKILNSSITIRSIGKIRVIVSEITDIPFAYRTLNKVYIVLPDSIIDQTEHFQLAIKHELQHHRQGDTILPHLSFFLKSLFFWNPLVHLAQNRILEVQELACDEALIGRKGVNAHQYCICLLTINQHAMGSQRQLVGTTSMAMGNSAQQLKRRVEMMFRYNEIGRFKMLGIMVSLAVSIMTTVPLATVGFIYDKKITLIEAHDFLTTFEQTEFPIEINEQIVRQLNNYIGTPGSRKSVKRAIRNREQFEAVFHKELEQHNAPLELVAIALTESGFENITQESNPVEAAGVWQFIPSTARAYGLKVEENIDERLDVAKETDAAIRLLSDLYRKFGDWRLAIIAYNAGEKIVQRGIEEIGTRNPWKLIEAGYEGDPNYLAKVMAGVLILKNPKLLN